MPFPLNKIIFKILLSSCKLYINYSKLIFRVLLSRLFDKWYGMKYFIAILVFGLSLAQPVCASRYYFGFDLGAAQQDTELTVIDNSLDPVIPNVAYEKDYQSPDNITVPAVSLYAGYRLGRDISVEAGFTQVDDTIGDLRIFDDGGETSTNYVAEETIETSFNYLAFIGHWPLGRTMTFHAKLGVSVWRFGYSQEILDIDDSLAATPVPNPPTEPISLPADVTLNSVRTEAYSDSGAALLYGLGLSFALGGDMELRLMLDYHAFTPEFTNVDVDHNMLLAQIGLSWHY